MITQEKLNVFKSFDGDADGVAHVGNSYEIEVSNSKDWYLIGSLIQDLILIQDGNAKQSFINKVNQKLKENCDSPETIEELKAMAKANSGKTYWIIP